MSENDHDISVPKWVRLAQGGIALLVVGLLVLHTSEEYFRGTQHPGPTVDTLSVVLIVVLMATVLLPQLDRVKVAFLEFRTKSQVNEATKKAEQAAPQEALPVARAEAKEASDNADPVDLIKASRRRLTEALAALAKQNGVEPSASLSGVAKELRDKGVLGDDAVVILTKLAQGITAALTHRIATPILAFEIEYSTNLMLVMFNALSQAPVVQSGQPSP